MLNAAQNKVQERTAPNSPTSTGAMDSLLQKLRDAGPTQRQQRDARRRARLKSNAKQRKASETLDASLSGDENGSAERDESSGGGGAGEGGTSDAGTDIDTSLLASSPAVAAADTPTSSATGAAPRKSSRRSANNDPASRAQNMLQKLKGGGDGGSGGGDESDNVSLSSLGSFRNSQRTGAEEGRRARRRQRQASSKTNGNNTLGLSNGSTEMLGLGGLETGDDAAAKAKSILLSMGARRGSENSGAPATSIFVGPSTDYTSPSAVDESETMIFGTDDLRTPTIEVKEVD